MIKFTVRNWKAVAQSYLNVVKKQQAYTSFLAQDTKGEEVYLFFTHGNKNGWHLPFDMEEEIKETKSYGFSVKIVACYPDLCSNKEDMLLSGTKPTAGKWIKKDEEYAYFIAYSSV